MNFIEKCQQAYYSGKPLISDAQYDELIRIGKAEKTIGPKGDFKHAFPMWSLQKKYPGRGDTLPTSLSEFIKTPKVDGNACSLVYIKAKGNYLELATVSTRGDGEFGKLINKKKAGYWGIPHKIKAKSSISLLQITGEVAAFNKSLENARNIVSGTINLDSLEEFSNKQELTKARFVAYGVYSNKGYINETFYGDLKYLHSLGFTTVLDKDVRELCPQDGTVYRLNNNERFERLGYTSKFPRGAFAVKEDAEYVVSTLLDVVWETGRTGKVVPTAIIETVNIDGANVSRATLNNPSFIKEMGLYVGCKIKVIRSGEIIPQILGIHEE